MGPVCWVSRGLTGDHVPSTHPANCELSEMVGGGGLIITLTHPGSRAAGVKKEGARSVCLKAATFHVMTICLLPLMHANRPGCVAP